MWLGNTSLMNNMEKKMILTKIERLETEEIYEKTKEEILE